MHENKTGSGSGEFWDEVSVGGAVKSINKAEDFINGRLRRYYADAKSEIQEEIESFYKKYANDEGLTVAEAKRRIRAAEFNGIDYERLSREAEANNDEKLLELLNRLSKKGQISRLELLELQIEKHLSLLYDKEQISVFEFLADTYTDSYYRGIYNIDKHTGVHTGFAVVNESVITKAVSREWGKGQFSEDIWRHRGKLSEDLRGVITKHLIKGSSIDKTSADLSKRCNVAFSDAKRLVRTETCRIHNEATLDVYRNEADIERYIFMAALDFKTSKTCRDLDGTAYASADAQAGVNYPPMHPNCRSTVKPEFKSDYIGQRLAKTVDGKYYNVPANMSYNEWYASLPAETRLEMELANKKARNSYNDKKQFDNYKDAFKNSQKKLPKSLKEFQEAKYNGGGWDELKAEYRLIKADTKQFESFRSVLGSENVPETVAEFRKLKYNNVDEFGKLARSFNSEVKAVKFRQKLRSGGVNLKVRAQKQQEHVLGTKQWYRRVRESLERGEPLENAFYKDVDVQRLVDENAGKGVLDFKRRDSYPREYFTLDNPIGIIYQTSSKRYVPTKRLVIHYSSKGTHAYPVKERVEE